MQNAAVHACQFRVCLCALAVLACLGIANGDTYQPKVAMGPWAGDLKIGPAMVAKGHRLWGTEIVGQDLTNANFDDCDLVGVALFQCNLWGVSFRRALMSGLTINDCTWGDNDFTDAVVNRIGYGSISDRWEAMGMDAEQFMSTWSYKNRDLSDCAVPASTPGIGYDFTGFKLDHTSFFRISNCRFTQSRLENSLFEYCDLTNCVFDDAIVSNVRFESSRMDMSVTEAATSFPLWGCVFTGIEFVGEVDFSNKNLTNAGVNCKQGCMPNFENASIQGLSVSRVLDGANIVKTQSFKQGNLLQIRISKSDFTNTDFSRQLLVGAKFSRCDFTNCKFDDAVITGISFDECTGLTRTQIESTWNFKHQRMADIQLPEDLQP